MKLFISLLLQAVIKLRTRILEVSILKWFNDKLSEGFYFPSMVKALKVLEKISVNYWVKKHVKEKIARSGKPPRWVSELYQSSFLVLGLLSFIFSEWVKFKLSTFIIIVFFSYRIVDISIFCLVWIFSTKKKEPLHNHRRSIAGFLLNIVEVAIYFSIITIWSGNLKDAAKLDKFDTFYKHMVGILTLSPLDTGRIKYIDLAELLISVLIILVVVGSLIGKLVREEVDDKTKR